MFWQAEHFQLMQKSASSAGANVQTAWCQPSVTANQKVVCLWPSCVKKVRMIESDNMEKALVKGENLSKTEQQNAAKGYVFLGERHD